MIIDDEINQNRQVRWLAFTQGKRLIKVRQPGHTGSALLFYLGYA